MEKLNEMQELLNAAKEDAAKFYNSNNAAGTRLRVKMQGLKIMAQEVRVEVSEKKAQNG